MYRIAQPPRVSDDPMKTLKVGGKVDIARRALGLTVEEFALRCRVPGKTMERICGRVNDPSAKTFYRILRYGRLSLDLFDEDDFGEEGLPE